MSEQSELSLGQVIKLHTTKPSYDEWLNKFYEKPQMKLVFKARHDGKKYIEDELIKKYRKAFKCC